MKNANKSLFVIFHCKANPSKYFLALVKASSMGIIEKRFSFRFAYCQTDFGRVVLWNEIEQNLPLIMQLKRPSIAITEIPILKKIQKSM